MDFKDKRERPLYNQKAHPLLKETLGILDRYSAFLVESHGKGLGEREIMVASFWREAKPDQPSFHPLFQAANIEVKNRSYYWKEKLKHLLMELHNECNMVQWKHENIGLRGEHIHIEINTGNPV